MKYLIVTSNFAPRGASPAVRTVHIVKYLHQLGHEVQVLTYDDSTLTLFSAEDVALSQKVPESVTVTRIAGGPLRRFMFKGKLGQQNVGGQATTAKNKFRRNPLISLLVPDPHVDSVPGFIRAGKKLIAQFQPDFVITHGYPFSMHWVGAVLKRCFPNVRWIADYGDPWVSSPVSELPRPAWRTWLDYRLENRWLRHADLVSITTEPTRQLYESRFKFLKDKTIVIPMGFDPDDIRDVAPLPRPADLIGKLLLVHTGRIYPQARDPKPFIRALEKLAIEAPHLIDTIRIVLVGEGDDYVKPLVLGSAIERVFLFVPWVPVQESIAWMKSADWLLLFGNKGGVQIPGKAYQYIGSGRPIFMTRLNDSDPTAEIVNLAEGSIVVSNDEEMIFAELQNILAATSNSAISIAPGKESDFSWPSIVSRLANACR